MSMSIFTVLMPLQSFNQGQALGQILGQGGQAYCFGKIMSQFFIVLEQKTTVFQNI